MHDLTSHSDHWFAQFERAQSPRYKRAAYTVLRPLLERYARRFLSKETRLLPSVSRVLPERGFPLEDRRAWIDGYADIRGKDVLLQGTGNGWDALTWLWLQPASITAVDLYSFARSWHEVSAFARRHFSRDTALTFLLSTLEQLPLPDESVDLAASDAVFEHCRNLPAVLAESYRVLRPGGFLYATYGPLWNCYGGDHFSGRGGLTYGYQHVEADETAYRRYFQAHLTDDEDAQNGGRYVELDLFSKLTTQEYLAAYRAAGFRVVDLVLEVSRHAVEFRRRFPARFQRIVDRHPGLVPDDLLIKAHLLILRKPNRSFTGNGGSAA